MSFILRNAGFEGNHKATPCGRSAELARRHTVGPCNAGGLNSLHAFLRGSHIVSRKTPFPRRRTPLFLVRLLLPNSETMRKNIAALALGGVEYVKFNRGGVGEAMKTKCKFIEKIVSSKRTKQWRPRVTLGQFLDDVAESCLCDSRLPSEATTKKHGWQIAVGPIITPFDRITRTLTCS